MRLLFPLHLFYPSKIGGPANALYWLCKGLSKNGNDVTVIATRMGIDEGRVEYNKWVNIDGIKTRYCDTVSKRSLTVIFHSIKCLRYVDIVVFSSICYLPNFFIAVAAILLGKRIVWSPRGELFETAVAGSAIKKTYFFSLRYLIGRHIVFHATSEAEQRTVLNYFPNAKVFIIPNYMELPARHIVNTDYSSFLYVGRIAPIKAIEKLIEGLSLSRRFMASHFKLIIVGGVEKQFEGYYNGLLEIIEQLCLKDKVIFRGSLTGEEKYKAFAAARYSFLVSNSENFGNVVIESLSQGTPVVASKGTPWEKLPSKHAGFWIDNTPGEIAKTIDLIINQSSEEYSKYRVGALNYSNSFDIKEHVREWETLLRR